ncbi:MAG: glycosyltransferase family 39 protein [Anaerolineae bacterium]|nr:glycosyltransferase family 39 protein [Anaerolineae bacterium]
MPPIITRGRPYSFLLFLLLANLSLLLPAANPLRVAGALLLLGMLPGWLWASRLIPIPSLIGRTVTAAGLSYTFSALIILLLHYLPGPIPAWQAIIALDALALLPMLVSRVSMPWPASPLSLRAAAPLVLIILIALFLRGANLHYSEFQGDESLAMITAAEAIEGHDDALFLRSKGPSEVLVPMALWRLTGTISEPIARLPFTAASLFGILTLYLIGLSIGGQRAGWLAAGFFAFNGFMVAFGRIVQYQALVVWFSALSFLMMLYWRDHKQPRFALLSGLFLGTGLLAHYDAILVLPAVGWLLIAPWPLKITTSHTEATTALPPTNIDPTITQPAAPSSTFDLKAIFLAAIAFVFAFSLPVLLFYLPFVLDPQANRTGDYVGGRIGNELRNNLPDFFHFNTFYSSFYYIAFTGLLILGLIIALSWRSRWQRTIALILAAMSLAVVFKPDLLATEALDLSVIPFALLLLTAAVAAPRLSALIIWLAVPFLGYNFVVALGLTHIYTIVPAWSILAALGWLTLTHHLSISPKPHLSKNQPDSIDNSGSRVISTRWRGEIPSISRSTRTSVGISRSFVARNDITSRNLGPGQHILADGLLFILLTLSTLFFWNAFVRHDVEYWQDYPNGHMALFWTPYDSPPAAGFFGFAHRAGWKAIGSLIDDGSLAGDYSSNEEPDVTTWYTRGAPRACDPQPEFYFLADDLVDLVDTPTDVINDRYDHVGSVTLPNQKQMRIMQQRPATLTLDPDEPKLARAFDQTATPAAFARSARGSQPIAADFGSAAFGPLVRLIGYDLDTRRAYPGGRIPVTLYWQTLATFPTGYQIFTHLESEAGPVAQSDGVPVCWTYPTDTWRPGQIIADQHALTLAPEIEPGQYPLTIGLYLPDTFERLDRLDAANNPAGTSLTLTTVEIRRQN